MEQFPGGPLARLRGGLARRLSLARLRGGERQLIGQIRARRLSYLSDIKLAAIADICRAIERSGTPGMLIEAGCALGGSTIFIASLKRPGRPLRVYDVFDMIPPPSERDTLDVHERYRQIAAGASQGIEGDTYYGYVANLYEVVQANLASFGVDQRAQSVELIRGLVQETLLVDQPVAFAHIDVDWYDPVMTCLQRIFPQLVVGGSILIDDYFDWGGCRRATDEFLGTVAGQYRLDDSSGSLKVTRARPAPPR